MLFSSTVGSISFLSPKISVLHSMLADIPLLVGLG